MVHVNTNDIHYCLQQGHAGVVLYKKQQYMKNDDSQMMY